MRIAYCLLVHKNPAQVTRLVRRIYSPDDLFQINVFRTKESPPSNSWTKIGKEFNGNVSVIESKYGPSRGRFGLVAATLDSMRWFADRPYDYFVNLSGQCYPLKNVNEIKSHLGKEDLAYIEYFKLPSTKHWVGENGGLDRIRYYWTYVGDHKVRFPRMSKRLPRDMQPYGGAQWFCLPRRFVDFILAFVQEEPRTVDFYKRSRIPEEMFFQTVIMNSNLGSQVVNDSDRYIDWSASLPSPAILRENDLTKILASGKLFARKFDVTVDGKVLDLIDRDLQTKSG